MTKVMTLPEIDHHTLEALATSQLTEIPELLENLSTLSVRFRPQKGDEIAANMLQILETVAKTINPSDKPEKARQQIALACCMAIPHYGEPD